jgi:hypothetical protein
MYYNSGSNASQYVVSVSTEWVIKISEIKLDERNSELSLDCTAYSKKYWLLFILLHIGVGNTIGAFQPHQPASFFYHHHHPNTKNNNNFAT